MNDAQAAGLPDAFRAPLALRRLNIVAVGFSLAAATGVILGGIFTRNDGLGSPSFAVSCAVPTLVFGLIWARIVRIRIGSFPIGWLAAIPLAALNAGTALTAVFVVDNRGASSLLETATSGLLLGGTIGVIAWGPALVVTLFVFGVPIYNAQRAADRGLGSEDRGERVVAIVASAISACAMLGSLAVLKTAFDHVWIGAIGAVGLIAGALAASYAGRREANRRHFLERVESGDVEGFRIDAKASLLVQVSGVEDGYYRMQRFAQPVVELDQGGVAKRTLLRP